MPKNILVVDDEPHVARTIQMALRGNGYEAEIALDGREALLALDHACPDLIVLDIMMPTMDGFEVMQTLKSGEDTRDIPVIMLTAKTAEEDMARGLFSGADCYLTKPFDPAELLTFVERILGDGNP
jgi:DNA-binding response OmpR family regulator